MMIKATVLIPTYNGGWDRIKRSINSVLLQKNVQIQIVIVDDCSTDNCFTLIRDYFIEHQFTNYVLIENKENHGTVTNILLGITHCEYKYVKILGQGDFFADSNSLYSICNYGEKTGSDVVVSDAQRFGINNNELVMIKTLSKPQVDFTNLNLFKKARQYISYNDIGFGSTALYDKECLEKYLQEARGNIRFAEDQLIKLMILDNRCVSYFKYLSVLYEAGVGISFTRKQLLFGDSVNMKSLMLKRCNSSKELMKVWKSNSYRVDYIVKMSFINKIKWYFSTPGIMLFKLRFHLHPRYVNHEISKDYIYKCLHEE